MAKKSRRLSVRINELIRKLRSVKSAELEDFEKADIGLEPLDQGAFRQVYTAIGLPVVVKIPLNDRSCLYHARREIRRLKQVRRSSLYRVLKRYLPKVYYADKQSGIIVMRFYGKRSLKGNVWAYQDEILDVLFHDAFGGRWSDYCANNFGVDSRGQLKVLDLGI